MISPMEITLILWGILLEKPTLSVSTDTAALLSHGDQAVISLELSTPSILPTTINLSIDGASHAWLDSSRVVIPPGAIHAHVTLVTSDADAGPAGQEVQVVATCSWSEEIPSSTCGTPLEFGVYRAGAWYLANGGYTFGLVDDQGDAQVCGTTSPMTLDDSGVLTIPDSGCFHLVVGGDNGGLEWALSGARLGCVFGALTQTEAGWITVVTDRGCLNRARGDEVRAAGEPVTPSQITPPAAAFGVLPRSVPR